MPHTFNVYDHDGYVIYVNNHHQYLGGFCFRISVSADAMRIFGRFGHIKTLETYLIYALLVLVCWSLIC